MRRLIAGIATHSIAFAVPVMAATVSAKESRPLDDRASCGSVLSTNSTLNDYRRREIDAYMKWSVGDVKRNHYDPAIARIRAGEYSHRVMADLNFLLRGFPNHYPALQALIEYDLGGGESFEFPTTACYFARAREYVPDDTTVLLYEGYYYWKKGDKQRAKASYEAALAIDPKSVDAHYNLGLLCVELGQLEEAREHARVAYSSGYPLPGLRSKLQKAGQWSPDLSSPRAQ